MITLILALCGLLTGLLSGMLGIGGGIISVPVLYFLFSHAGLFEENMMQVAASTSLAISLLISFFSSLLHFSKKSILFTALKFLLPGLLIGCIAGALLAHVISSKVVQQIFGISALSLGLYFVIAKRPHFSIASKPNGTLSFFGMLIGSLSSLLGIGGGTIAFPTLLFYGVNAKNASATSSCITTISSLIGTVSYLALAWKIPKTPDTLGYIYLPAFLLIGAGALLTTPLGVKLSQTLNISLIKRIFGTCLIIASVKMLIK